MRLERLRAKWAPVRVKGGGARALRLAVVIALGLSATACDKCGGWFKYTPAKTCGGSPSAQ